jgi:tRNA-2-methylthio-N6-dimethylallyladenosine synthase
VGFPGETEEDFLETMRVVEQSRFGATYTFQYSKRPGTPAATLPDQLPKAVVQERYERLLELVNRISLEENQALIGNTVEVLVSNGGRKDDATHRMSGRGRDNRLVHFEVPAEAQAPRPGDLVTATITEAGPYHLIADTGYSMRKTIAGDAWDRAEAASCGVPASGATSAKAGVSLGLPSLGKPNSASHSH